jgi:DNA-binding transcriptional LysR family regulator
LAPFLSEFLLRYPNIKLSIATTDRLVNLVDDGFDLALHTGRVADSGLIARRIRPIMRIMCAAPEYISAHGSPSSPRDLAFHNCLIHTPTEPQAWHFTRDGSTTRQPLNPLIAVDSYYALAEMARRGLGIARISRNVVKEDLKGGGLVQVLAEYECTTGDHEPSAVWLLYPDRRLARRTRVFIDEFSEYMKHALA